MAEVGGTPSPCCDTGTAFLPTHHVCSAVEDAPLRVRGSFADSSVCVCVLVPKGFPAWFLCVCAFVVVVVVVVVVVEFDSPINTDEIFYGKYGCNIA